MTGIVATISSTILNAFVAITNQTISVGRKFTATASYSINNNGSVTNQGGTVLETWLNGVGGSTGSYDVMVTPLSGVSLTSGTTGSWLNCGTSQTWSLTNANADNSTLSSQFTVQIRLTSSGVVQSSATITLSATSSDASGGPGGP